MTINSTICVAVVGLILLLGACTKASDSPAQSARPAVASAASRVAINTPRAISTDSLSGCGAARDVLASCAQESDCSEDMTMFMPAAARDVLVTLEAKGNFNREAFDRYCEQACRKKSPQVDSSAFDKDVCIRAAALPTSKKPVSSASTLQFTVDGLALGAAPVALDKVKAALGEPLKTVPSPYGCDSAYASEKVFLLTYPNAAFESDGKTAVLRRVTAGASVGVHLDGMHSWSEITPAKLKALPGFEKLSIDSNTIRLAPGAGASLESGWDFHFKNMRLEAISHWIGC